MAPVKYHMNLEPCWNFLFNDLSDRFRLAGVFLFLLLDQMCCCICVAGFQLGFNEIST